MTGETAKLETVAVTGGSGLIGKRLLQHLAATGAHLRLLTRTPQPDREHVTWVIGDITDPDAVRRLVDGATEAVHLAGMAHSSPRTEQERAHARAVNVGGTKQILDAALAAGVRRTVITSSAHVYASQQGIGLTEDSPLGDTSFYGQLKIDAERHAEHARDRGLDVVTVRPCLTYGPGVRFNLASLMRAVDKGYYFHVGTPSPLRSFLSVDTAGAAIVHLLQLPQAASVYNLADENAVRLNDWTNTLADALGARHPRTVPAGLLRGLATTVTPLRRLGLPVPLTQERLAKLTSNFSLSVSALEQSGFCWPSSNRAVIDEMVAAYRAQG